MKVSAFLSSALFSSVCCFAAPLDQKWVDIWTAAPLLSRFEPPDSVISPNAYFQNTTIRQTLHLTLDASQLRVKLTNAFGTSPLEITASTAALTSGNQSGSDSVDTNTLHQLTFSGQARTTIPAGGDVVSDPINMATSVHQELTVSLYLTKGRSGKDTTAHDKAHTTTWVAAGDQTTHPSLSKGAPTTHWYYLAEIQAQLPSISTALICVGDSITDGTGSGNNDNNRWVDDLFRRMQSNPETNTIAVLNAGIGGNHLVTTRGEGPTAVERIKGIIAQPGVRYIALLDGVNDIGHTVATDAALNALYDQMTKAMEEIISEVHSAGLFIFGGTLTPSFVNPSYSGSPSTYANPNRAALRDRLNKWILNESKFDYIVDYAAAVANKTKPDQYQDRYAYTNYVHPNVAGHQAMADAWDLSVFKQFSS